MCVWSLSHKDRDLTAFLFSAIPRKMDLGIYISTFVCLRGGLFVCYDGLLAISNRERRWTDLVWGKVDRFWVSGTDLGAVRVTCE